MAEAARRLTAAGFVEQPEAGAWPDEPGGRYLIRDGTMLAWFRPAATPVGTPMRIFAAHTDSPTLKVKPRPDVGAAGWRQVAVEVYGGALWNSWLDRDLGLAGRLALFDGTTVLVDVHRPLLRVPQLAIHLDRAVNSEGLHLDAQHHLLPIWGLGDPREGDLVEFLAAEVDVDPREVAAHDLVVHDVTPPARLGAQRELLAAPRLDNLASVHAGIGALLAAAEQLESGADPVIPVFVGFDHEEIGSGSATGAAGPLLETVLTRLAGGFDARAAAFATSRCLSVDVTHAAHPNYLGHHEPGHRSRAQRRTDAEGQRQPALRHRRPGRGRLASGLPGGGRADPGVRREEHHAVRLHRRADPGHPARHPDRRRRDPGAVHALGARAVRRARPRTSPRRGHGVPDRSALSIVSPSGRASIRCGS